MLRLQRLAGNRAATSLVVQGEGTSDHEWVDVAVGKLNESKIHVANTEAALNRVDRGGWSETAEACAPVRACVSVMKMDGVAFGIAHDEWTQKGRPASSGLLAMPARGLDRAIKDTDAALVEMMKKLDAWFPDKATEELLAKAPESRCTKASYRPSCLPS